jgi:hypothetical protein
MLPLKIIRSNYQIVLTVTVHEYTGILLHDVKGEVLGPSKKEVGGPAK